MEELIILQIVCFANRSPEAIVDTLRYFAEAPNNKEMEDLYAGLGERLKDHQTMPTSSFATILREEITSFVEKSPRDRRYAEETLTEAIVRALIGNGPEHDQTLEFFRKVKPRELTSCN